MPLARFGEAPPVEPGHEPRAVGAEISDFDGDHHGKTIGKRRENHGEMLILWKKTQENHGKMAVEW